MAARRAISGNKEETRRQKLKGRPLFIISDMDGTLTQGDASLEVIYELGRRVGAREAEKKGLKGREARLIAERKGREFAGLLERNWHLVDNGPARKRPDYYPGMAVEKTFRDLVQKGYRIKRSDLTKIAFEVVRLMPQAEKLFEMIQRSGFSERRMCYILTANTKAIAEAIAAKLKIPRKNVYGFDFVCDKEGYILDVKNYWQNSKVSNLKKIESNIWQRILKRKGLGRKWARHAGITRENVSAVSIYLGDSVTDIEPAKYREKKGGINIFLNLSERVPRAVVDYAIATSKLDVLFQYFSIFSRSGPEGLALFVRKKIKRRGRFPLYYSIGGKEHVFKPRKDLKEENKRALEKLDRVIKMHREVAGASSRGERLKRQAKMFGRSLRRNIPSAPALVARNVARPFRFSVGKVKGFVIGRRFKGK